MVYKRSMAWLILRAVLVPCACLPTGHAQAAPADQVQDVALTTTEGWIGRALMLRGFPAGDDLKYDAAGSLQSAGKTTDGTLAGFDLQKVSRRGDGELQLEGVRVAIRYNPEQHIFERHLLKLETMKLRLATAAAQPVQQSLAAIFSVGIDPALQRSMPLYWSHYFIPSLAWQADNVTGQPIVGLDTRTAVGLVYPVAARKVEPQATVEATQDHVRGTVQVRLDVDAQGLPQRIVVRQPLGYGLDAKTVDAVERYRFQPGSKDGAPAVFEFLVNQSFQ